MTRISHAKKRVNFKVYLDRTISTVVTRWDRNLFGPKI